MPMNRLQISGAVRSTRSDDGAVLLDVDRGLCFSLNPVGSLIWKMLEQDCGIDEIRISIANQFDLPEINAANDVNSFVSQLLQHRLIFAAE